jgi:hypothetical protein
LLTRWLANQDNNRHVKTKTYLKSLTLLAVSTLLLAGCAEPRNDGAPATPTEEPKVFVTAPRTGVASPARTGPQPLTAQVRPLTQAQRTEQQRQQNRSEAQRQFELAGQRFNPRRGEFGVSETLRGLGALLLGR